MDIIRNVVWLVYVILGVCILIKLYVPIIKNRRYYRKNSISNGKAIEEHLTVLKSSENSQKKAEAFVSLMSLSYVLVHVLVNKGNNYIDRIQREKFKKKLTPEYMRRLNGLEGKYE